MKKYIKRILIVNGFIAIITVISCGLLKAREVKVSFTGDIIMHIPVKTCSLSRNKIDPATGNSVNNRGFDFLFQQIKPVLDNSHICVGNMEFPLSPPYSSKPKIFNCYPEILPALKKAGFTLMHIANNHILDQGQAGIKSTIALLDKYGLDYIGVNSVDSPGRSGIIKLVKDIRIGFIGYTGVLNYTRPGNRSGYCINWLYDTNAVMHDIDTMRSRCDYLVMVAHAGDEYKLQPEAKDRKIYRRCIERGVDLVVGHHPHLVQPIEEVALNNGKKGYIFYSLGNFISNQGSKTRLPGGLYLATRDSIILHLFLKKRDAEIISRFEIIPIRTKNHMNKRNGIRFIRTVPIGEEIQSMVELHQKSDKKNQRRITKEIGSLKERVAAIRFALMGDRKYKNIQFIE